MVASATAAAGASRGTCTDAIEHGGVLASLWAFAMRLWAASSVRFGYGGIAWSTGAHQRIAILAAAGCCVGGVLMPLPVGMARGRAAPAASDA